MTDTTKEARVKELLANPNRQPADDKELDLLLHGSDPVITGDVTVEEKPVKKSGITSTKTLKGANVKVTVTEDKKGK